jgi:hypothetical protein
MDWNPQEAKRGGRLKKRWEKEKIWGSRKMWQNMQ